MDNLTHSLFGAGVADAYFYSLNKEKTNYSIFRKILWAVSIIANNFPDIDVLWSSRIGPNGLNSLVYHRGHTHTFLMAIPQGILVALIGLFATKILKIEVMKEDKKHIWILAILGGVLHVGLDFLNSYGIHPFWPWSYRWYYGDTLFIIEPTIWVLFLLYFFFVFKNKKLRLANVFLFVLALGLIFFSQFVLLSNALFIIIFAAILFFILKRQSEKNRIYTVFLLFTGILVLFFVNKSILKSNLENKYSEVVLNPLPGNPFCWRMIAIKKTEDQHSYQLQRALVATQPKIYSATDCIKTLPVDASKMEYSEILKNQILWMGTVTRPIIELRSLQREYCDVAAYLTFSRAPYWMEEDGVKVFYDLRFDLMRKGGFSRLEVKDKKNPSCSYQSPWQPPRIDLLNF